MTIKEITLKNFKGFADISFEFNEQFNVIIGNNAKGKTTVLDAIATALGAFLAGIDGSSKKNIDKEDIRTEWQGDSPRYKTPCRISAKGEINQIDIDWERSLDSYSGRTKDTNSLLKNRAKHMHEIFRAGKEQILPLLAYHGTGRLWSEHSDSKTKKNKIQEGIVSGYLDCLSAKSSSKAFLNWYRWTQMDEGYEGIQYSESDRKKFNDCISCLVPEWQDIRYVFKSEQLVGKFRLQGISAHQIDLAFHQLSDGYRNMISLAADLAYRCLQLNPKLPINETPGIVLIDELDLHLHPTWQREIVSRLKSTFPKIQFICTTHSPFIVQSLKAQELINLDRNQINGEPYTKSIEDISETEMGVDNIERSERFLEMERIAEKYFDLLSKKSQKSGNIKELDKIRTELEKHLLNFTDNPAFSAILKAELNSLK